MTSYLWPKLTKFKLIQNIRAKQDPLLCYFLLQLGNGYLQNVEKAFIGMTTNISDCITMFSFPDSNPTFPTRLHTPELQLQLSRSKSNFPTRLHTPKLQLLLPRSMVGFVRIRRMLSSSCHLTSFFVFAGAYTRKPPLRFCVPAKITGNTDSATHSSWPR